uniref:Ig-like domain-containing protein n=1 Tax=Gadus morhua TaxID=8049 RepID=A0A8C5FC49_GADMO
AVGESVMLKVDQSSPLVMASVAWRFHLDSGTVIPIITSAVETTTAPEYINRTKFDHITGSLELSILTLNDTGLYEVIIIPPSSHPLHGAFSGVTVTPNTTELMEFSSSVRISCQVSTGTYLSYLWMNGSSEITVLSDRVQVGDGGTSLTILNVTRYDRGPYTCNVSNLISTQESAPLTLHPIYGPVSIQINVPVDSVEIGQTLHLSCRAESTPPAHFTWMNGVNEEIGHGAEFLKTATLLDSGEYTCLAVNNITKLELRAVQSISVTGTLLPFILYRQTSSVRISCHVSTGTSLSYLWMNGSSEITVSSDRVQVGDGGTSLTILNVTRYDRGPYTCNVSNLISTQESAPLTLHPIYGPVSIQIYVQVDQVQIGQVLHLSCRAESTPPADFTWMNGMNEEIGSGADFQKTATLLDSGEYTCLAVNSITKLELRAVQKAISNVELKTNDTVFVEFRDSAVFTCSAKGSSPSFLWMNGSSMVTVGNWVQIGAGGSTLTILNMTRYDQGPLTCNVSNSVSNFILPSPNISDFLLGSDLNVSCSAQSNPHAQLKWAFQGDRLTTTGPELKLHSVSEKDSGLYSCLAYNNVTQLYSNITKSINIGRNLCNLCICISI